MEARNAYMREWNRKHPPVRAPEVYVAYVGEVVVYVGRTSRFGVRMSTHRKEQSAWLGEFTRLERHPQPSFGDALVAEALLIRQYQPKYNKDGVTR